MLISSQQQHLSTGVSLHSKCGLAAIFSPQLLTTPSRLAHILAAVMEKAPRQVRCCPQLIHRTAHRVRRVAADIMRAQECCCRASAEWDGNWPARDERRDG